MSFAYLPLFTGDYLRDTRGLSPLRHGVYLLALVYCWDSKGPMPLDEQECAGICNCRSGDEVEALRFVLGRFFVRMDDGHYNKRIAEEVAKSERLSATLSEAGLKGVEAKRAKARAGARAKANATLKGRSVSPSPSPSLSQEIQEPTALVAEATPQRRPACPTEALIALYHEHLPMLPRVEVVNDSRKRHLSSRWREVVLDKDIASADDIRSAAIDWFAWFFCHASKSRFLTGKVKNWKADFDFLMTPSKFAKVVEGSYHGESV